MSSSLNHPVVQTACSTHSVLAPGGSPLNLNLTVHLGAGVYVKKLLTFPLRLAVGWGLSPRLLGLTGMTMLVLLRLTIGWHFYSEGIEKHQKGNWDATPFFANARGPFAEDFRRLVWDGDGKMRRNMEEVKIWLALYRDRVIQHYGFSEAQQTQAKLNYVAAVKAHQKVLEDNKQDLQEYDLGLKRIQKLERDPARNGVAGLREQRDTIRRERQGKIQPTFDAITRVWKNYETAQNSIATSEQKKKPTLALGKPRVTLVDTNMINAMMPIFDIVVGLCLLVGLFTPVAALAAAGFLGSVFLSQFPPVTGPGSSYYQLIEGMACLVLAGTAAGRFAGLDYFLHLICRKVWGIQPGED